MVGNPLEGAEVCCLQGHFDKLPPAKEEREVNQRFARGRGFRMNNGKRAGHKSSQHQWFIRCGFKLFTRPFTPDG